MTKTRKFNGKRYTLYKSEITKRWAESVAEWARNKKYLARIIYEGNMYRVYIHKGR